MAVHGPQGLKKRGIWWQRSTSFGDAPRQRAECHAMQNAQRVRRHGVIEADRCSRPERANGFKRGAKGRKRKVWNHAEPAEERGLARVKSCAGQSRGQRHVFEIERHKSEVALGALAAGAAQTGGVTVVPGAVGWKLERINPASNLKNLFSLRAAARLGKSLLPASLLAVFAVERIAHQLALPPFSNARLEELGSDVYGLLLAAAWLLFAWSLIDYVVEWQSRESRLKMSRQDLRDEYRETEGNPQIRGRIRSLQRQMRRRRVKSDVARAAVVLTNPTHYAVALGFDFVSMEAPKVLAKGRNLLAEEIKAEARWAGVPIVENPPLARSLYRSVEVGQAIPAELYAAVAAILAYLYRQRVEAELRERRRSAAPGFAGVKR